MAFDAFLKCDTIDGESTDENHKDWIEVLSFSHGVSQPASGSVSSGGSRAAERCDHQPFSIVKTLDRATAKLTLACCKGDHLPVVEFELCRAGGDKEKYMSYKMYDVIVASVSPGGSAQGGESLPLEEVTFNYGKIEWTYTQTDHKTGKKGGEIKAHWDLHKNIGG